jgi:exopolysaccharide biosynthesis polyprenyl glycosylphosphotransferase
MAQQNPLAESTLYSEPQTLGWMAKALRIPAGAMGLCFSERRLLLFMGDLLILSGSLLFALWVRSAIFHGMEEVMYFPLQPIWWVVLIAVWIPIALVFDCYNLKLASESVRGTIYAAGCVLLVSVIYLVIPVYSAPLTRSRLAWFFFTMTAVAGESLWRLTYAYLFRDAAFARRVVIVGAGAAGQALATQIAGIGRSAGVDLLGFIDDDETLCDGAIACYPILGKGDELLSIVKRYRVQDLVVAITHTQDIRPELLQSLITCWTSGASVVPMPVYYEHVTGAIPAQHLGPNLFALLSSQDSLGLRLWTVIRRLIDILVGGAGLLVTGVLFPIVSLAVVLDSPGPVLYRQERVGRGGRRFRLAKFRSMIPNAETNGAVWSTKDDPRVTRVGRILRSSRLDELPQFWNLVTGTMTLIGPRPERPEFVEQLSEELPFYPIRHSITPGLTGWAQVRFRYASTVDDALEKLCYDFGYLKRRGPVLDALICFYTLRVLLRMEGS